MKSSAILHLHLDSSLSNFISISSTVSVENYEDLIRIEPNKASQFHITLGQHTAVYFIGNYGSVPQMGSGQGKDVIT